MSDHETEERLAKLEAFAGRVERWAEAYGARLDELDERTAIRPERIAGHVLQTRQFRR